MMSQDFTELQRQQQCRMLRDALHNLATGWRKIVCRADPPPTTHLMATARILREMLKRILPADETPGLSAEVSDMLEVADETLSILKGGSYMDTVPPAAESVKSVDL